jgi:hypothetical protein
MQDLRRSGADLGVKPNQSAEGHFSRDPPTACILWPDEDKGSASSLLRGNLDETKSSLLVHMLCTIGLRLWTAN